MLEERILDLPMREADVAIRMKEPSQADLIRRRIMEVRIRLYASRAYLARAGTPETIEDVAGHRLIVQSPTSPQVRAGAEFVQPFVSQSSATLTVNTYFGILQGVIHGLGIGSLPDYVIADFPDLVQVLPGCESAAIPVYLAYVQELRQSKRVCAFRDFVLEEISTHKRTLATGA